MRSVTLHEAYRILGLSQGASPAEVKAAYRRLVAQAHPDRGGSAAAFFRVRVAYEILSVHLRSTDSDDDIPVPEDLRKVIEAIVADFRRQKEWAEARTAQYLEAFERQLAGYIARATRAELRNLGGYFQSSWNAMLVALFGECNERSDQILQRYESWFSRNTRAVFDDIYRKELRGFLWRMGFWEIFLVVGGVLGAMTAVVGWSRPWRVWVSLGLMGLALAVSFAVYRWRLQRIQRSRERVEPLSVVPFQLPEGAELPTTGVLRRGRRTVAGLGLAGLVAGSTAAGGIAVPLLGVVVGSALGGALDRMLNPTERMRESMQADLERFIRATRPQLMKYVGDAHSGLLEDLRSKILTSYKQRVAGTVRLLTADDPGPRIRRSRPTLRRRTSSLPRDQHGDLGIPEYPLGS